MANRIDLINLPDHLTHDPWDLFRLGNCGTQNRIHLTEQIIDRCAYVLNRIHLVEQIIDRYANELNFVEPTIRWNVLQNRPDNQRTRAIVDNSQNVHDSTIQEHVRKAIETLMQRPYVPYDIDQIPISDKARALLAEFIACDTEFCSTTYEGVFARILDRIGDDENLLEILETELLDSEEQCFVGRISRLVNVLNGIDFEIQISDKDRLGNIMAHILRTVPEDQQLEVAERTLREAGYSDDVISEWTNDLR